MRRTHPLLSGISMLTSSPITSKNLARRWMVGMIKTTRKSLNVTTQRGVRSIPNPAMRQYKTQMAHLCYPRLKGIYYADIMETKIKFI